MAKAQNLNIDISSALEGVTAQFRGLNTKEPGQWPIAPKVAVWVLAALAMVFGGWYLIVSGAQEELDAEVAREQQLRAEYTDKLRQAVNLGELRRQKLQVEEYVIQLEKQLPGRAEMAALLSDINQAGLGRGLQFELFRPGSVEVKDHYAVLPIAVRVGGGYHDIGSFVADVANLSRIVTLHDLVITRTGKDTNAPALTMEGTAKTYRYLDPGEIEVQKKAKADRKKESK